MIVQASTFLDENGSEGQVVGVEVFAWTINARIFRRELMSFGIGKIAGLVTQTLGGGVQDKIDPTTGFKKKLDNVLGSASGQAGASLASGFLDDFRQRRNTQNRFSDLKDQGLNPYEIHGGGGGGAGAGSSGNTLGNGQARALQSQQNFASTQAQLDRDNKLDVANIQQQASLQASDTGARRLALDAHLSVKQQDKVFAETQKIEAETRKLGFEYDNFWPIRYSNMSPENGMFALASFNAGVDFQQILNPKGQATPEEIKQNTDLLHQMVAFKSVTGRETIGVTEFFKWVTSQTAGASALIPSINTPNTLGGKKLVQPPKQTMRQQYKEMPIP